MNFLKKIFARTPPPEAQDMQRNEPCWCGSGKKYKKCHQPSDQKYFMKIYGTVKHPG